MNIYFFPCLLAAIFGAASGAYGAGAEAGDLFRRHCAELARTAEKDGVLAVAGQDGWLFLAGELRHIGAGKFWGENAGGASRAAKIENADPWPVILDFNAQLKKIGVKLIVVPVPPKAVIYPEMLPGFTNANGLVRLDAVHQEFYARLRSNGVAVLDLTDFFLQKKNTVGRALAASPSSPDRDGTSQAKALHENLYCRQDSHWSGRGCVLAAEKITAELQPLLGGPAGQSGACASQWREIEISGDLWQALNRPALPREKIQVRKIGRPGADEPVEPDAKSDIILLGDSHNLVFHAGDDLLARGAGLPDQLALALGRPVELVAVRGSGATPARINLMRRARQNKDYWKNKKCVIWCFSAREFTESDGWRKVPLE